MIKHIIDNMALAMVSAVIAFYVGHWVIGWSLSESWWCVAWCPVIPLIRIYHTAAKSE